MNFKTLALALGLVGSVAATGAQANISVNYGDVTGQVVADIIYERTVGAFTDLFFFEITQTSLGTGIVSDVTVGSLVNIDNLSVEFFKDTGVLGAYDGESSPDLVGSGDYVLGQDVLAPGHYFFKISGDATGMGWNIDNDLGNGTEKGAYFFSASAAPVPEPEAWAMMAMGLGLVGLQLRRRKSGERIS